MAIRTPLGARDADGSDRPAGPDSAVRFEELWGDRAQLQRFCERIVGDPATAADIVQETYVRAWNSLDELERRSSFMPWLATIARRLSLNELRRQGRAAMPIDGFPDLPLPSSLEPDELIDLRSEMDRALDTLTARERRLLLGQILGGNSVEQLACEENTSPAAVRSVLMRARTKLRQALAEAGARILFPIAAFGNWARRHLNAASLRAQQFSPSLSMGSGAGEAMAAAAVTLALVAPSGAAAPAPHANPPTEFAADSSLSIPDEDGPSAATSPTVPSPRGIAHAILGGSPDPTPPGPPPTAPPPTSPGSGNGGGTQPGPVPGIPPTPPPPPPPDPDNPLGEEEADDPADAYFSDVAYAGSTSGTRSEAGTGADNGQMPHLFALGENARRCSTDCTVLFHSDDGGETWRNLPAEGLRAETLMVAPAYPVDNRVYAMGTTGLQLSTDGGKSFVAVESEPHYGPAVMSPRFSTDDPRILVGTAPPWEYDAESDLTEPFAAGPLAGNLFHFAFTPGVQGATVFAGSYDQLSGPAPRSVVYRCEGEVCGRAEVREIGSRPHVTVASGFESAGLVFAWGAGAIYRSTDGGSSFVELPIPTNAHILDLEEDRSGTLYAAVAGEGGDISAGGLLRSTDRGRTWDWVGQESLRSQGLRQIVPLLRGRLLAVPSGTDLGGFLCSRDRGTTWDTTCA